MNSRIVRILFTFLFLFYLSIANASILLIQVVDESSKEALPFAHISFEESNKKILTNSDGYFQLNPDEFNSTEIVYIDFFGYTRTSIALAKLATTSTIYLKPNTIILQEVVINSKPLSAEQIIELVKQNYTRNHPDRSSKQKIYFHSFENTPFSEKNKIKVKKSSFVGLDKKTVSDIVDLLPDNFNELQDTRLELYQHDGDLKIKPISGISLEESSMKTIGKKVEQNLEKFFQDLENSATQEDVYYKFRTGILSMKAKNGYDSTWTEFKNDTINYTIKTSSVKAEVQSLLEDYADLEDKSWDFVHKTNSYEYTLNTSLSPDSNWVYIIHFIPKKQGIYKGTLYITPGDYALKQVHYAFVEGKQTEKFKLFGFGHAINHREAHIIYERKDSVSYPKYITAKMNEFGSLDRNIIISRKEKRFFVDKELNKIKLDLDMAFNTSYSWELMVLDDELIDATTFENTKQPTYTKLKKEYTYSGNLRDELTQLAPSKEVREKLVKGMDQ